MNIVTLLGFVAALLTTISFIPQVVKTIKTKHTKDLSLGMYSILASGMGLWLIYGLMIKDFPLIIANSISLSLAVIILFMKIKYK